MDSAGWPAPDQLRGRFVVNLIGNWSTAGADRVRYATQDVADRVAFPMQSVFEVDPSCTASWLAPARPGVAPTGFRAQGLDNAGRTTDAYCVRDIIGAGTLGVITWAEQVRTGTVAHTMGVVTFSLYALFFSITTRDERQTVFSLDTFSDKTFVVCTGGSVLTLFLSTVFGPLQALLDMTNLDIRQWLVCGGVAASIVVVSEVRKAVRRRTTAPV